MLLLQMKRSLAKSTISKFQVMIPSEMTVQLVKEEVLPFLHKMAWLYIQNIGMLISKS